MPLKSYHGIRSTDGDETNVEVWEGEDTLDLDLRLDIYNHSPTGFEWGYGGSGPAQLALAILVDYLGEAALAVKLHQKFKWAMIAGLGDTWEITAEQIDAFLGEEETDADL